MRQIDNIVFDLGGVLIDWNPRYMYRKVFSDEQEMETFLTEVCTPDWNEQQDAGRTLADATAERVQKFPQHQKEIEMFYARWDEMLGGPIQPTVDLLKRICDRNQHGLFSLTNWSHETFHVALERYEFLGDFEDIVVSGVEKCKKPDLKIYEILINRTNINPSNSLFIDDSHRNIEAAKKIGFQTFHFQSETMVPQLEALIFP
jgi:2-haloacid dehalogenase